MNKKLQPLQVLKKMAIAVAALLLCPAVQAQTTNYAFGTQIGSPWSTTFQPTATFATLSVTTTDSLNYVFDLRATSNFNALFGTPNAWINRLVFNTNNSEPVPGSVRLASGGGWGVNSVYYHLSDVELGGIAFEFTEGWGAGDRLVSGERVVWETSFANPTTFLAPPFALKVSLGEAGSGHAWYIPTTPIPEPETYAMLLAGLGMLGFAARRRQKKQTAAA